MWKKPWNKVFGVIWYFRTCTEHAMCSCYFNCSTVRKFHCQLEFSDLLKNWYLIISRQAYAPLTLQKFDYHDLCCFLRYPISIWGFLSCILCLWLFIIAIFHQSFYVLHVIIMFLDSSSLSFIPNSFLLCIYPNTNICWSELSLPLWPSTQCSDP